MNLNNYANLMPTLRQLMHDVGFIKKYNSGIYMINELAITSKILKTITSVTNKQIW